MQCLKAAALLTLVAGAILLPTGCSSAAHRNHDGHVHLASDDLPVTPYPLTNCVVSGKPLGPHPYVFVRTGQQVKLCCKKCLPEFNKTPDHFMAKIP
jgi:hypothetical protein